MINHIFLKRLRRTCQHCSRRNIQVKRTLFQLSYQQVWLIHSELSHWATDESMEDCIVVRLKWSARPEAGVATLDLFTLMKPCMRAHCGRQTLYDASALIVDTYEAHLKGANAQWATEKETVKGQDRRDQRVNSQVRAMEPHSYEEAVWDPVYERQWREAIEEELLNLRSYTVWIIESLPQGRRPVGCKWVFKIKYDEKGSITQFKARLVAQGFFTDLQGRLSRDVCTYCT